MYKFSEATATYLTDGNGLPYEMQSIHRTPKK
jgi:hypothetical protein